MSKVAVIGIDPDSNRLSAIQTIDDEWVALRKTLPEKHNVAKWLDSAYLWIYRIVKRLVADGYEVHVFVERPFVSPKTIKAAIPLCRLNGAVMAGAQRGGASTVMDVQIQSWKKTSVGKGNASKPEIAKWCKVYWRQVWDAAQEIPATKGRQDLIDAAGINRYGDVVVKRINKVHEFKGDE